MECFGLGQHFHQLLTVCCQLFPPASGCTLGCFLQHFSSTKALPSQKVQQIGCRSRRRTAAAFVHETLTVNNVKGEMEARLSEKSHYMNFRGRTSLFSCPQMSHFHHSLTLSAFYSINRCTFFLWKPTDWKRPQSLLFFRHKMIKGIYIWVWKSPHKPSETVIYIPVDVNCN